MKFHPTRVEGAFLIESEPVLDERGGFMRTWCVREAKEHGLCVAIAQCSVSSNRATGTLRGMHYQTAPAEETKVVRCIRGSIFDVIVDLRKESPSYRSWFGAELSRGNHRAMYVPRGVAHGFLTLEDDCDVHYQMSALHEPAAARGFRWNEPSFGITWPTEVRVISERDRTYPDFSD
jgi:dTDP-4-dehydrorhamnose 3,5-epimerase